MWTQSVKSEQINSLHSQFSSLLPLTITLFGPCLAVLMWRLCWFNSLYLSPLSSSRSETAVTTYSSSPGKRHYYRVHLDGCQRIICTTVSNNLSAESTHACNVCRSLCPPPRCDQSLTVDSNQGSFPKAMNNMRARTWGSTREGGGVYKGCPLRRNVLSPD